MIGLERALPIIRCLVALGRENSAQCPRAAGNGGRAVARTAARTSVRRAPGIPGDKTPMASDIRSDHGKHEMKYLEQNSRDSRTRPSAALLALAAIAFAGIMGTVAKPASAANDDYMFCYVDDRQEKYCTTVRCFLAIILE